MEQNHTHLENPWKTPTMDLDLVKGPRGLFQKAATNSLNQLIYLCLYFFFLIKSNGSEFTSTHFFSFLFFLSFFLFSFFFGLFVFLWLHPQNMEVPRLGVQLELQLPAYTTATEMQDPSRVCDLHHSSWQCWSLNPLSEPGSNLHPHEHSRVRYRWATVGTPSFSSYI